MSLETSPGATGAWRVVPLGSVCNVRRGEAITKKDVAPGDIPVVAGGIGPAYFHNCANRRANVITVSGSGANAGFVNFYDRPIWASDCSTIEVSAESLSTEFVYKFLQSVQEFINCNLRQGAAQPHVYPKDLARIEIPMPPFEEQKRIVAVLDEAFAVLDRAHANADANLADAEDLLSSFMEEQLEVSGGQAMTLQEMIDDGVITGHLDGNHGSEYPRKEEFVSDGVPYISANCIVEQQIDFDRAKYLSVERAARIRKGLAKDQDVIFAHNASVGPVALLNTSFEQVVLGTSVTYYRCNPQRILPEFLMYEMRGASFRAQYEAVMGQATRSQVPITMQRTFTHRIPSIEKQREIVKRCKEMDSSSRQLVARYTKDVADIAALRQSLLQAAFSGQLT